MDSIIKWNVSGSDYYYNDNYISVLIIIVIDINKL